MQSGISEGAKLFFEGFGEYWGFSLYPAIFLSVFMCTYLFLSLVTWFFSSPL